MWIELLLSMYLAQLFNPIMWLAGILPAIAVAAASPHEDKPAFLLRQGILSLVVAGLFWLFGFTFLPALLASLTLCGLTGNFVRNS